MQLKESVHDTDPSDELNRGSNNDLTPLKSQDTLYKKVFLKISSIKPVYLILFGIITILIITLLLLINSNLNRDPVKESKAEAEMVKRELSKHMILPKNEEIDIRKITNKMEDPFFVDAEIGDYLIIFYKNRIAYIYSIKKNIIINAGVVFIDPKTATTTNTQN